MYRVITIIVLVCVSATLIAFAGQESTEIKVKLKLPCQGCEWTTSPSAVETLVVTPGYSLEFTASVACPEGMQRVSPIQWTAIGVNPAGPEYDGSPSENVGTCFYVEFPTKGEKVVSASCHECGSVDMYVHVVGPEVDIVSPPQDYIVCNSMLVEAKIEPMLCELFPEFSYSTDGLDWNEIDPADSNYFASDPGTRAMSLDVEALECTDVWCRAIFPEYDTSIVHVYVNNAPEVIVKARRDPVEQKLYFDALESYDPDGDSLLTVFWDFFRGDSSQIADSLETSFYYGADSTTEITGFLQLTDIYGCNNALHFYIIPSNVPLIFSYNFFIPSIVCICIDLKFMTSGRDWLNGLPLGAKLPTTLPLNATGTLASPVAIGGCFQVVAVVKYIYHPFVFKDCNECQKVICTIHDGPPLYPKHLCHWRRKNGKKIYRECKYKTDPLDDEWCPDNYEKPRGTGRFLVGFNPPNHLVTCNAKDQLGNVIIWNDCPHMVPPSKFSFSLTGLSWLSKFRALVDGCDQVLNMVWSYSPAGVLLPGALFNINNKSLNEDAITVIAGNPGNVSAPPGWAPPGATVTITTSTVQFTTKVQGDGRIEPEEGEIGIIEFGDNVSIRVDRLEVADPNNQGGKHDIFIGEVEVMAE